MVTYQWQPTSVVCPCARKKAALGHAQASVTPTVEIHSGLCASKFDTGYLTLEIVFCVPALTIHSGEVVIKYGTIILQ